MLFICSRKTCRYLSFIRCRREYGRYRNVFMCGNRPRDSGDCWQRCL